MPRPRLSAPKPAKSNVAENKARLGAGLQAVLGLCSRNVSPSTWNLVRLGGEPDEIGRFRESNQGLCRMNRSAYAITYVLDAEKLRRILLRVDARVVVMTNQ